MGFENKSSLPPAGSFIKLGGIMDRISIFKSLTTNVTILLVFMAGAGCFFFRAVGFRPTASIAPGDGLICYVNAKDKGYSIYVTDPKGVKCREVPVPADRIPFDPVFSPDGKKILYLFKVQDAENTQGTLCLMDVNGANPQVFSPETGNVTDAAFSPDGQTLYYLSAGSYGHYSPIAQSHPHEFDVHSIDIAGKALKQWTHLKAYGMSDLSVSNDGKTLYFVVLAESNTLMAMPLTEGAMPVSLLSDIWDAKVSPDQKEVVFTKMKMGFGGLKYELYRSLLDPKAPGRSELQQLTSLNSMVFGMRYFTQRPYVLFVQQKNWPNTTSPRYRLMEISLDGSDLKEITLPE